MRRNPSPKILLSSSLLILVLIWISVLVSTAAEGELRNPFFAFDNGVGRGTWTPQQQAEVLNELGYAGIGYSGTTDLPERLRAFQARNLTVFNLYVPCTPGSEDPYPPQFQETVKQLEGTQTTLWLTVQGETDDEEAARVVRSIADVANRHGVQVALYPHFGFYVATARDALRLVRKVDRGNVGVTINLCHELRAGNASDLGDIIKETAPRLSLVSINGADHEGGWDKLIKTLDQGEFDVATFLKQLSEAGYTGPIGLQCYNVKGDQRENLKRSMDAWKKLRRLAAPQ